MSPQINRLVGFVTPPAQLNHRCVIECEIKSIKTPINLDVFPKEVWQGGGSRIGVLCNAFYEYSWAKAHKCIIPIFYLRNYAKINEAETKQSFSLPAGAGSICTKRETALSHFLDTVSSTVIRGGN